MAELEVAKHGKNVIEMAASREHGFATKVKEIALEIAIIVFAVSISIWFHSMSEHRHEQQQVRAFLTGLKTDLARDIMQLSDVGQSYRAYDASYDYMANLDPASQPDSEKFEHAFRLTDANHYFIPERSRYEGFKSSGKLINIEDEELLSDILALYQMTAVSIQSSERYWGTNQEKLRDYLEAALESGDTPAQRYRAMTTPNAKRLLRRMATSPQQYERYKNYVALSSKIIKRIDATYAPAAQKT